MDHFVYRDNELHCEEVPVADLVAAYGTPLYIYSKRTLLDHYRKLDGALRGLDHLVCYSVKTNGNLAVLRALHEAGSGFDIVSGGELFRVQRAGGDPAKVVYAGVGKRRDEIAQALTAGIHMFNCESWPELENISRVAAELGVTARCALRVNPDVDAHTHAHITTGTAENKFGILIPEAGEIYARAKQLPAVQLCGVHVHLGSQLTETGPYREGVRRAVEFTKSLLAQGYPLTTFNLGGGFGINYGADTPPQADEWRDTILPLVQPLGLQIIIEPGRFIAGNSGILALSLTYVKRTPRKAFYITDAGMNDLIRPALYGAKHWVYARREDTPRETADLVGPICESGDFFLKAGPIPQVQPGEWLVLRSAGAYGFAMASNYNARPRAAEIMVDGSTHRVVRAREAYADLVHGETA